MALEKPKEFSSQHLDSFTSDMRAKWSISAFGFNTRYDVSRENLEITPDASKSEKERNQNAINACLDWAQLRSIMLQAQFADFALEEDLQKTPLNDILTNLFENLQTSRRSDHH